MTTPPAAGDGAGPTARPGSLTDWLRSRTDEQLARLLRLRPDLALPAPADVGALAARVGVRSSTQRAVDALDARTLGALETLVLAADDSDTVDATSGADVGDADLELLFHLALVWGDRELVHLAPTTRDAVGPYPAGLGRPAALLLSTVSDTRLEPVLEHLGLPPARQPVAGRAVAEVLADPARIADLILPAPADEREVLELLASGSPVGTVRSDDAPPTTTASTGPAPTGPTPTGTGPVRSAPSRLVDRGLLVPLDRFRFELPREVGLVLRADAGPASTAPPHPELIERPAADLDSLGSTAVLETLRLLDALADLWSTQPPPVLRAGGVGVRDLRRTARDLAVDEATAALIVEVAHAARLLNSTDSPTPVFLPTPEYDAWAARGSAERFIALEAAWLAMTRQPSLVNQRGDRDRVIAALSPDVERGTVPALRRRVLDTLAGFPPGAAPAHRDDVLALLAWQQPRRATGQRPQVEAILAEADLLGVTAAGGLTGYTRTLLAGSRAAAEHALAHALPEPVEHFLVQPDLTVVVPGPPQAALGTELSLLADLESTGGASVYRITEASVRRAFDAGRSGAQLDAFVTEHSRTPVPQALHYLIEDAGRRHGVLRAGAAGCYLRCDDEALLSRVLADRGVSSLGLRRIAPTVVVSEEHVWRLLDALRAGGYAPAAEGPGGELVTLGVDPARAPDRTPPRVVSTRGVADTDAQLAELVRRVRSGDALQEIGRRLHPVAGSVPGVTSAATMELLRRAVREDQLVWIGVVGPDGTSSPHEVQPISLAAGSVRGYEAGRQGLVSYPVHRITAVRMVDRDDD